MQCSVQFVHAFIKVSQKLNYYVFMLFGLVLASFMFFFAAKSYSRSQSINTQSGTNLNRHSGTNPEARVNQTEL